MITKLPNFKHLIAQITIAFMLMTSLSTISILGNGYSYGMDKVCKVTASTLYVRSKATTSSSKVGKLKKNTYKIVKSTKKDSKGVTWYKVTVGSKSGYISSKYAPLVTVSIAKVSNLKGTVNVSSGSVYLRSGPGVIYSSVGKLSKGNTFTITGKAKDVYGTYWYQLKNNNTTCYTSSKYVKTSSTSTTTATTKPTTSTTAATKPTTSATTTTTSNSSYTVTTLSGLQGKVDTASSPLNVRKGPGTSYSVVGSLAKGKTFAITGKTTADNTIWYRLNLNNSTAFASGKYVVASVVTSSTTSSGNTATDTNNSKTLKARQAAVDWAIGIANDNSFHYGMSSWAHHNGCYFCGTNQASGSAKRKDGATVAQCEKTYCCNPFVTAAYNHGAGAKEMDCKVSSMRCGLANDTNKVFKNTDSWLYVDKPSKATSLKVGDILLTPTHAMLYAGDNKVVHAAHHDNGVKNSYWNESISLGKLTDNQWSRTSKIYRYIGTGKY